jgi:hypothetical protein
VLSEKENNNFFKTNWKILPKYFYRQISLLLRFKYLKMSYELTGKLVVKYDTVQKSATFKTREFAVEKTDDVGGRTITNFVKFQSVQDKTSIIDKVNVGDEIKVYFNIKGTKWEKDGKTSYFTNLDAWRIEPLSAQTTTDNSGTDTEYLEPLDTFSATSPDAIDDLPF